STLKTAVFSLGIAGLSLFTLSPCAFKFSNLWESVFNTENYINGEDETFRKLDDAKEANQNLNTATTRLWLWQSALKMFYDHPIIGIGPGNYNVALKDYAPSRLLFSEKTKIEKNYLHSHNVFLNILAEFGLSGLIITLAFVMYLSIALVRRFGIFPFLPSHALLSAIFLSFCFDNFFHSQFYFVLSLTFFLLFIFPENTLYYRHEPAAPDKPDC